MPWYERVGVRWWFTIWVFIWIMFLWLGAPTLAHAGPIGHFPPGIYTWNWTPSFGAVAGYRVLIKTPSTIEVVKVTTNSIALLLEEEGVYYLVVAAFDSDNNIGPASIMSDPFVISSLPDSEPLPQCEADLNQDGTVGLPDFTIFQRSFGHECPRE